MSSTPIPSTRNASRRLRELLVAVAAIALVVPALAEAQPQAGPGPGGQDREHRTRTEAQHRVQGQQRNTNRRRDQGPPPGAVQQPPAQFRTEQRQRTQRETQAERRARENIPVWRGYQGQERHDGQGWRGDRSEFGQVFRSMRRFNAGRYHRPPGWYSHRWYHGEILPRAFWVSSYWLTNYWLYSLSPPPYGYIWVRYGNDALLVDRYTGEIVEVVYDVFY